MKHCLKRADSIQPCIIVSFKPVFELHEKQKNNLETFQVVFYFKLQAFVSGGPAADASGNQ